MQEIKPTYVTFEQAKLLKEKGFDVPVKAMYHNEELLYGGVDYNHNNPKEQELWSCLKLSAPEQWQVVEWLRVNYGIWVNVRVDLLRRWFFELQDLNKEDTHIALNVSLRFSSSQEAYSAAFNYILQNNLI